MAKNITTNTTTSFDSINAGKLAFVKVTGNWGGSTSIAVHVGNGNTTANAWEVHPVDGTKTANFANSYQLGDVDGIRLVSTSVTPNTTNLWAQVVEIRP